MMFVHNLSDGFTLAGAPLVDNSQANIVCNNNKAAMIWANAVTMKHVCHMELHDNAVRKWVQDDLVKPFHAAGKRNPSDIFTKEIQDSAHFRRLRDCMMVSKAAFLKYHHNVPTHITTADRIIPYYSLRSTHDASQETVLQQ